MPLSIQTLGIYCCPNKNANQTRNKGPVQKIPVFLSIPFCGLCCWASLSWPSVAAGMLKYHVKSCGSACDVSNMSWSTKHQKSHRTDALMNFQPSLALERIQIDLRQTSDFLFVLFFFLWSRVQATKPLYLLRYFRDCILKIMKKYSNVIEYFVAETHQVGQNIGYPSALTIP